MWLVRGWGVILGCGVTVVFGYRIMRFGRLGVGFVILLFFWFLKVLV